MTFANWCLFLGVLLLIMSISDSLLKKIPFSSAAVYMILGVVAGLYGLKLIDLSMSIHDDAHLLEILTEVVVLVSLFAVGLKLPVRSSHTPWKVPILLATVLVIFITDFAGEETLNGESVLRKPFKMSVLTDLIGAQLR